MSGDRHVPVLMAEVLQALEPQRFAGGPSLWMDGTLGMGGHAKAVMQAAGEGARLMGTDRDTQALGIAGAALSGFGTRIRLVHKSFAGAVDEARAFLADNGPAAGFNGILLDLGVSSLQLDEADRGFSFMRSGPLDMRMDALGGQSAAQWLAGIDEAGLVQVLRDYGEERQASRLARAVLQARDQGGLNSTTDLALVAEKVLGRKRPGEAHPATRLFQALRLAVNAELEALESGLPLLAGLLAPGGRLAVISFHSLEDRLVKDYFKAESKQCLCPPGLPECRCGHLASLKLLNSRPIIAGDAETAMNPRSRSAKLRTAEKL